MANKDIHIVNRRARHDFEFIEKFVAGIMLTGTEIKAVREGKVNLKDGYCIFRRNELFVKNIHISEYGMGNRQNHDTERLRKLLLHKRELKKLMRGVQEKGLTIIPVQMFLNDRGFAKLEIALAKGKREYDKRASIKEKDIKREMDREKKDY